MGENHDLRRLKTDVLVVGSEGAGARAAIAAAEAGARVLMATKALFGKGGATLMAPYSCMVAFGHADPRDNPWEHFKDTVRGGHWIGNQEVIWQYTSNAPQRMLDLERFGAKFNKTPDGKFEQVLMPGHTYPRAIHFEFRTGSQFKKGLVTEVSKHEQIEVLNDFFVLDILKDGNKVAGALAYDIAGGEFVVVEAPAVVVATGGAMELFYPHCDASSDLTGDGAVMSLNAGAELVDVEFMQFFPTALVWPPALNGCIWIGDVRYSGGGLLYNKLGQRFMAKYDPERMELSTRDMTSRAIVSEIIDGRGSPHGGVYLSVTHLGLNQIEAFVADRFPNWSFRGYNFLESGLDLRKDAAEIAPTAHFYMGGVKIDVDCSTNVPGLYVGGEASAGLHGANRVEGNALSETQVHGAICGENAASYASKYSGAAINMDEAREKVRAHLTPITRTEGIKHSELRKALQETMWTRVGVVRTGEGLEKACQDIDSWIERSSEIAVTSKSLVANREFVEALETKHLLTLAQAMAKAAINRKESRGSHYRRDYPDEDNRNWLLNSVVWQENGEIRLRHDPVQFPYYGLEGNERRPQEAVVAA